MPDRPFDAVTWTRRANIPGAILNGVYSGQVVGPINAAYDPASRTVQSFSQQAHHFRGFVNTAQISFDDGATWTFSFNEDSDINRTETCPTGWSLPNPSGVGSIHVQVRVLWDHAFLIASGAISPGGISIWGSDGGSTFFKQQDLATWPALNDIPATSGGHATFHLFPSVTQPILLEGSGPDGEDAYWIISSYSFEAGGTSNRTTFKAATLWRSIDGGISWEAVRDMEAALGGMFNAGSIVRSTSGRLVIVAGGAGGIWWTDGDLLTGTFTDAQFSGASGIRGPLMEMYGGTFYTFSQGTLTGPGSGWISCDDCENFFGVDAIIPGNEQGFGVKLGPSEILIVAPDFDNPTTATSAYYSADGGENFFKNDPWLVSGVGERPVLLALRSGGRPIVVARGGGVFICSDTARGVAAPRTDCPLANAGLFAAAKVNLCGAPIAVNQCD